MAIVKIVKPNRTPEEDKKVLKDISSVIEKILYDKLGSVKVELIYCNENRQAI